MSSVSGMLQAGLQRHKAGDLARASAAYREVLRIDPTHADSLHLLGVAAYQQQRSQEAIEYIRRAIAANAGVATYHCNLGAALRAAGQCDEAVASYRHALSIAPRFSGAHYNLGNVLKEQNRFREAVDSYRKALEIDPTSAETWNNLGDALKSLGRLKESVAAHQRALQIRPAFPEAHFNLGNALRAADRWKAAVASYQRAVRIRPDYVDAYINLGFTFEDMGNLAQAIASYERALAINNQSAEARFNRALARLRSEDFECGWSEYEWRWRRKQERDRYPSLPLWDGTALAGRRILVYAEQGVGDEIMFASCLPEVIAQAEACAVQCDPRLAPLFARSFPAASVVAKQADAHRAALGAELRIPLGSLPRYLRGTLAAFPATRGYLNPDPKQRDRWRERLEALGPAVKVGISWRGGKDHEVRRRRSTTLAQWADLLALPACRFVNLQYGDCRQELAAARARFGVTVHDWDECDPLGDLDGFAALVSALDLVVSVDNSTVHLAGALGAPVWALLPFTSDWRWLMERTDSPWYPSLRLFRQPAFGDWGSVFASAKAQLVRLCTC